jgi:hypothetical protein
MNAQELRIGNCVYQQDGQVRIIDGEDIHAMEMYPEHSLRFKPIPLTPEILEKCGFKTDIYLELANDDFALIYRREVKDKKWGDCLVFEGNGGYDYPGDIPLWHIKYLHQLQNLYYALAGEELEIELT